MSELYMLIGVPGSGKSTWLRNHAFASMPIVLSTDDYIEREAALQGKTYNEIFDCSIAIANDHMWKSAHAAFQSNATVVWDQTNLDVRGRRYKLSKVPATYQKHAVFFPTPDAEEHQRRLFTRPGKMIPQQVISGMINRLAVPTLDEGFDYIIIAQ